MSGSKKRKGNFEKYGSIMVDIETLSTHHNAAIIEIGAVEFNKKTGETGAVFNMMVNAEDWCNNERHVDGKAIKWWFSQPEEARRRFVDKQSGVGYNTLECVLNGFAKFVSSCDNHDQCTRFNKRVRMWGNGSIMDITILENAFRQFNIEIPWAYWAVNDVRTIVELKPEIKENCVFEGTKHSAVDDCFHQIKYTTEIIKQINI